MKMRNLFGLIIATFCLVGMPPQVYAAKPGKAVKATKERLVLMPLRVGDDERNMLASMETALVQGLQQKYEVFSGEQVAQKAKEIFNKESHSAKKDCDETRCMQGIAEAFQAELIATANLTKIEGGYLLALSIQNIFDNKVVYSNSLPCKNCDAFQVVDKLKELSGSSVQASPSVASSNSEPAIVPGGNPNDPENSLWAEVQKGNSVDDYGAYLTQYPKGKYVALAKSRLNKLKEQAAAELAQQEQSAWDNANSGSSEDGYQGYLNTYPKGRYAALATARISKLKKEATQAPIAKLKQEAAQAATQAPKAGKISRDCPECPEMVVLPEANTIGQSFAMGKTEVTQGQWKTIMGNNPSRFSNCGDTCPVEQVSWNDAKEFIQKLNAKTGKQYRLPSEAEWEYACRSFATKEYCGSDNADSVAWYDKNSGNTTHPTAQKQANAFGLYDMSGNVWEWVEDCYEDACARRVLRGGSWLSGPEYTHYDMRYRGEPADRDGGVGFRVARTLP